MRFGICSTKYTLIKKRGRLNLGGRGARGEDKEKAELCHNRYRKRKRMLTKQGLKLKATVTVKRFYQI